MEKAILVCLSYTGNTWAIGEAIQEGIASVLGECRLVSLRQTNAQVLQDYDLIGIGSPVRLGKMPVELSEFIAGMNGLQGKHGFVFNTHAALPVNFMKLCVQALKNRGLVVVGFKNWYSTVYLPYVPKPYFTDNHPDAVDLKEAEEFGRQMVSISRRVKAGEEGLIPVLPEGKEYEAIYGGMMSGGALPVEVMQARAQGFSIDTQKCTRCGFCIEICPTHSIDLSVDPPVFQKCDQCWMCEQTCPEGAISFNYPPLHKSHNIVVMKGFVPHLKAAEAAGRFRPLVKDEEVGWETPLFKTKASPRFKVVDEDIYRKRAADKKRSAK